MNAQSWVAWPRLLLLLIVGTNVTAQNVTTSQHDNARTGTNQRETTLTPRNVNARQFGKRFSFKVDGDVHAQPLFVTGLEIPGEGLHDVVFVATENDGVYAFDAYGHPGHPLWRTNFLTKASTTVPEDDLQCPFIPTVANGHVYVGAKQEIDVWFAACSEGRQVR